MLVSGDDFYCGNSSGSLCQFALKNQIPSAYVHPSTKQCNYSIDTSQFVTQSDFNSLKNSIGNPCRVNIIHDGWYSYTRSGVVGERDWQATDDFKTLPSPSIIYGSFTDISLTITTNMDIKYTQYGYIGAGAGYSNNQTTRFFFREYTSTVPAGTTETATFDDYGQWITLDGTHPSFSMSEFNPYSSYKYDTVDQTNVTITYRYKLRLAQLIF